MTSVPDMFVIDLSRDTADSGRRRDGGLVRTRAWVERFIYGLECSGQAELLVIASRLGHLFCLTVDSDHDRVSLTAEAPMGLDMIGWSFTASRFKLSPSTRQH